MLLRDGWLKCDLIGNGCGNLFYYSEMPTETGGVFLCTLGGDQENKSIFLFDEEEIRMLLTGALYYLEVESGYEGSWYTLAKWVPPEYSTGERVITTSGAVDVVTGIECITTSYTSTKERYTSFIYRLQSGETRHQKWLNPAPPKQPTANN